MRDDTKADLFDLSVLQNEIHRRAAQAGLSCSFVEGLAAPHYDWAKRSIAVPRFKLPRTIDDVNYLRAAIIHEIGHANRNETLERISKAKIDMSKPFGRILNMVEDGAMEREIAGTWLGDAVSLGTGTDVHVRRQLEQIAKMPEDAQFSPEHLKTNAVYMLGQRYRHWDKWSAGSRERLRTEPPKEAIELTDKLDAAGWGDKMARVRTTDQVFDLAKQMYKELFPDDDKDPESDPKSGQNQQGEGEGKPKKGEEGEGGEDKTPAEKGKARVTPWEMLTSDHTNDGKPDPNAKVDYDRHVYRRPADSTGLLLPVEMRNPHAVSCSVPKAPPFVGALRMYLQAVQRNRFEFGLTSGKLDQRKLAKLALPVVPGSDSWRKVFKRRIPGKKINTAVQIMVDGSGSMSGRKTEIAADAADMLCQAFAGPLRIKTAVHGFDAAGRNNRIWKYKDFSENVQPGTIASKARGVGLSGNADGDAVIWAMHNIMPRPEHRKIIIVLSDGMPTDGTHVVDPGSMLKYAIESARKRGIEVFGIGIEDRSVTHFYGKDCKTISNVEELPKAIIETLKNKIQ